MIALTDTIILYICSPDDFLVLITDFLGRLMRSRKMILKFLKSTLLRVLRKILTFNFNSFLSFIFIFKYILYTLFR
jgi:hypothetical protein